jgi:phage protein D
MTELLLESSAPVFQVEGQVKGELARDLRRLEVEETTAGMKSLRAVLVGHGPKSGQQEEVQLYLDGVILDFGKKIDVSIGPEGDARTIFTGYISALESSFHEGSDPEVILFAEDKLMSFRLSRRSKSYTKVSDAGIAQAIATQHGLQAKADAPGPTYDVVQQFNLSDLAFLRERARLIQAEIWFDDGTLYFRSRNQRNATELTLVRGNHLIDVEARADLAHQRTSVKVSGYDAKARDKIESEAGQSTIQSEITGGRTGPSILQSAFGANISYRVREVPLKDDEAQAFARAEMLRRARAFVTVTGTTRGSPDMIVGSKVTLDRMGSPFDGPGYYVTRVCHTYDNTYGHRTRFEAERPTLQEGS